MSILQNAVDSIVLGVEDYNNSDPRRLVSCTRNIFSGILLLFKHKLSLLSPPGSDEVLLKQNIIPTLDPVKGLQWKGKGENTVDVHQIKERFDNLKVTVDWKRVERIRRYRNNIEHYFSSSPDGTVRALIAESFLVIRDFLRLQLGEDPLNLLGPLTWNTLTNVAEVYNKEKQECVDHIKTVDWRYDSLERALREYQCPECGSGLIDIENPNCSARDMTVFTCRSCGEQKSFEELAPLAIADYFDLENYSLIRDGDSPVTITCPTCDEETYLLDDDVCVLCEMSVERECQRCGATIIAEEIDGTGFCSWCAHMISKDDRKDG